MRCLRQLPKSIVFRKDAINWVSIHALAKTITPAQFSVKKQ